MISIYSGGWINYVSRSQNSSGAEATDGKPSVAGGRTKCPDWSGEKSWHPGRRRNSGDRSELDSHCASNNSHQWIPDVDRSGVRGWIERQDRAHECDCSKDTPARAEQKQ